MGNAGYGNHTPDPTNPERPDPEAGQRTASGKNPPGNPSKAQTPPAGPHADPSLTNEDATPGAGTLTPSGDHDDTDSTSS
ncbi:hypothetical protein [Microvirga rosea]|uniref:hypothetical protein n=1 Tax=Microvirga rosea TaxID=2715425 RepID=UPI001D0A0DC6|nr:hypothetical protein [Microvirga rosea]MCB8819458.1 hypothetical protein [Microvirga rosea]